MPVHYSLNKKVWMDSGIMKSILSRLYCKMCLEKRKVGLFWNNATCHPAWQTSSLSFYPKIEHHDCNLLTLVSSRILNINTESCLLATSLVYQWKENGFSNNWGRSRIENDDLASNHLEKRIHGDHQAML